MRAPRYLIVVLGALLLLRCRESPMAPVDTGWPPDSVTIPPTVSYTTAMWPAYFGATNSWIVWLRFTSAAAVLDSVHFKTCSFGTRLHRNADLTDAPVWDSAPQNAPACPMDVAQIWQVSPRAPDSMGVGGVSAGPGAPLPSGHFYVALAFRPGGQFRLINVGTVDLP